MPTSHPDATSKRSQNADIQAKLQASEERYQAFIHNSSEGIWRCELEKPFSVDLSADEQIRLMYRHGYLAEANDAMARTYGLDSANELVGCRLGELLVESDPQNVAYLRAFIDSGYSLRNTESRETDINGHEKCIMNSLVGVVENGQLLRAWGTQHDVTEQHLSTDALRASEARLGLALQASQLGMWEWNLLTGQLTWSDQLRTLFGLEPGREITYELYVTLLHPEDAPRMQALIQKSMRSGDSYAVEHRVIWPDGSVHWVLGRGQAFMENGKPARMIGTSMSIDDRKAAEALVLRNALLNTERSELIRLSDSKDAFIALASHQLRTPATSVKQYLGMLIEGFAGDLDLTDTQSKMLQTAYQSNDRQISIINDLLMVATVDAGKVKLRVRPTDLISLLEDIVADYVPKFKERQQTIVCTPTAGKLVIPLDSERIRMAIENLVDNASKYSLADTTVTVTTRTTKNHVAINVQDQGVGIDKTDIAKLFQKFSRIPNSLSTTAGGTGLGLYWSHEIVELHGGKLTVASLPGRGTTFTISLPLQHSAGHKVGDIPKSKQRPGGR